MLYTDQFTQHAWKSQDLQGQPPTHRGLTNPRDTAVLPCRHFCVCYVPWIPWPSRFTGESVQLIFGNRWNMKSPIVR